MNAMAQIFLSYAREDEEQVEELYQRLLNAGVKPWMDTEDILPGEIWETCIRRAVRNSDFFLACLSTNSVRKRGFVQKEIRDALGIWQEKLENDIYLIPARLDDCDVPESLCDFQWVNLFQDDGWQRLRKAIKEGMDRQGKTAESVERLSVPANGTRNPSHRLGLTDTRTIRMQKESLTASVNVLEGELVSTEPRCLPELEFPPRSLKAFVSLDERERELAVKSVQLTNELSGAERQLYAQVLVGMLHDQNYNVVWEVVQSLKHIDTSLAVEELLEVCRTRKDQIVYEVLDALGQLGDDADTVRALEELKALVDDLPILGQADNEEERSTFLRTVETAIAAISGRLEPSPAAYAEYVLKE